MGIGALILTTVGARTSAERSNPVGWFPGPDGSWLIVASAAGAVGNPVPGTAVWMSRRYGYSHTDGTSIREDNIAAHPDQVKIEVDGQTVSVTAEQLHGTEGDQAWQQITAAAPRFAQYQSKTDRELPVIRLVRRSEPTG